ncbi:hypothetical protein SAY86_021421 [Trapa natans]|uniref:Uncharacterized protein n=1 Tax=Trapa natans TaxID=22666 RepID=A0AAN7M8N0_TRANT|nr:hypothetical protein SAY86_021421 [Trapa natans]
MGRRPLATSSTTAPKQNTSVLSLARPVRRYSGARCAQFAVYDGYGSLLGAGPALELQCTLGMIGIRFESGLGIRIRFKSAWLSEARFVSLRTYEV